MGRTKLWIKSKFTQIRINVPRDILKKYKIILSIKGTTMQRDILSYIKLLTTKNED